MMFLRKSTINDIKELTAISIKAFDSDIQVGGKEAGGPPDYDSESWYRKMMEQNHLNNILFRKIKNVDLIRKLSAEERYTALELAWRVFSEYESPDYSKEGTEEFRKCLHDEGYLAGIEYYGAFDGERLIGLVGIRSDKKHICFFLWTGNIIAKGSEQCCSK